MFYLYKLTIESLIKPSPEPRKKTHRQVGSKCTCMTIQNVKRMKGNVHKGQVRPQIESI